MKILPPGFRVHLSTAVALMIGASVILGLNVTRRPESRSSRSYGWPTTCLVQKEIHVQNARREDVVSIWSYHNLIADVITTVALIVTEAVVLEKRIEILARLKTERE